MAAFYHTRHQQNQSLKKQHKNRLPRFTEIVDRNVKDFFPISTGKRSNVGNNFDARTATAPPPTQSLQEHFSTDHAVSLPKVTTLLSAKKIIASAAVVSSYPQTIKRQMSQDKPPTPPRVNVISSKHFLTKSFNPCYEIFRRQYAKINKTKSRKINCDRAESEYHWIYNSRTFSLGIPASGDHDLNSKKVLQDSTQATKQRPIKQSGMFRPTARKSMTAMISTAEKLKVTPQKLYIHHAGHLSQRLRSTHTVSLPSTSSSGCSSSPHVFLDNTKCKKFRITLKELSSASERIYKIHNLKASRNPKESIWIPSRAVTSTEIQDYHEQE